MKFVSEKICTLHYEELCVYKIKIKIINNHSINGSFFIGPQEGLFPYYNIGRVDAHKDD